MKKKTTTINGIVVDLATRFLITLVHAVGVGMIKFSRQQRLRFISHEIKPLSKNRDVLKLLKKKRSV